MAIDILKAKDNQRLTWFHTGIHPLTKMIVMVMVLMITGLWLDPRFLAPVFVIGLILAILAKTPKAWFIVMATALILTWYPTLRTTIAQVNPEYYKVLDPEWAVTPIATFNVNFLNLNTLGLTYGTLTWLLGRLLRYGSVVTWALLFMSTTPMSDIANTLYALKVPGKIVFVIQITYRFIPYMASVISQISDAQRLRGWNLRTWNPVKIIKRSLPIANPMIRRTAMIVDQVTIATQIRGFGAAQVTPLRDLTLSALDKALIAIFSLGFVVALVFLIVFQAGML
jgi:energy-coupling factor transporter transmembrane protein EcfT